MTEWFFAEGMVYRPAVGKVPKARMAVDGGGCVSSLT